MLNRINMGKAVFTYTVGEDPTVYSVEDLPNHPEKQQQYENWLNYSVKAGERDWRNFELAWSDWMLVPDATFAGEALAGSAKLADILQYRTELRAYNLTTDDRPKRPLWWEDRMYLNPELQAENQ